MGENSTAAGPTNPPSTPITTKPAQQNNSVSATTNPTQQNNSTTKPTTKPTQENNSMTATTIPTQKHNSTSTTPRKDSIANSNATAPVSTEQPSSSPSGDTTPGKKDTAMSINDNTMVGNNDHTTSKTMNFSSETEIVDNKNLQIILPVVAISIFLLVILIVVAVVIRRKRKQNGDIEVIDHYATQYETYGADMGVQQFYSRDETDAEIPRNYENATNQSQTQQFFVPNASHTLEGTNAEAPRNYENATIKNQTQQFFIQNAAAAGSVEDFDDDGEATYYDGPPVPPKRFSD